MLVRSPGRPGARGALSRQLSRHVLLDVIQFAKLETPGGAISCLEQLDKPRAAARGWQRRGHGCGHTHHARAQLQAAEVA